MLAFVARQAVIDADTPVYESESAVLQTFLGNNDPGPTSYRALRRLEASSDSFDAAAWMDVLTEAGPAGFRFEVLAEGGSAYIRSRVFRRALETEQDHWGGPDGAAFTLENYTFEYLGASPAGLAQVGVTPRRKDVLLVNGSIFLDAAGSLVRMQGRLSKTPSFWTRKVEVAGYYDRIGGVRLPVRFESQADIFLAGRASMTMAYDYRSVNGQAVKTPDIAGLQNFTIAESN